MIIFNIILFIFSVIFCTYQIKKIIKIKRYGKQLDFHYSELSRINLVLQICKEEEKADNYSKIIYHWEELKKIYESNKSLNGFVKSADEIIKLFKALNISNDTNVRIKTELLKE
jgi:predicted membrane protein